MLHRLHVRGLVTMDVSNRSRLRRQRDAHSALGRLLASAAELGLPAISWTIPVSGTLVGDVDSLTSTPAETRKAFLTWAGVLGAEVTPERPDSAGVTHLYGQFRLAVGFGVDGAIRATISPPFDGGDV